MFEPEEASGTGAAQASNYKSEEEWVQICGDHINVSMIADSSAQSLIPNYSFHEVIMHMETMATV